MPLPTAVRIAPDDIVDVLKASDARLRTEFASILSDPLAAHRLRKIRGLRAMIENELVEIERAGAGWLSEKLPLVFQAGGESTGLRFGWNQPSRLMFQAVRDGAYDNLLQATEYMREDTKRWIGNATRMLADQGAIEGLSVQDLARRFKELGPAAVDARGLPSPVTAIRYADGSRRTLDTYGEMLFRTTTATAHNAGVVATGATYGVTHYEMSDSDDCGLASHDDPRKVNGKVYPANIALAHTTSHPGCSRSLIARTDLIGAGDDVFDVVLPTGNESELARQLQAAQAQLVAASRRPPRTPRSPRTGRTPRARTAPAPSGR